MSQLLDKYSNKQKWKGLLWAIVPVLLICYLFAFRKTGNLITDYHKNLELAASVGAQADSAAMYVSKKKTVDSWQRQYLVDSSVMDAHVLTTVNAVCRELGLAFNQYKPIGVSDRNVWTRTFTVHGPYEMVLHFIYNMEQIDKLCRITSLTYRKPKAEKEGEDVDCTFYIQNIIK